MTDDEIHKVVDSIQFNDWFLLWGRDEWRTYIQWQFRAKCSRTGAMLPWGGRQWDITGMDEGQIVKTAFAALKLAVEHETMEFFKYKGVAVFDPHTPLSRLMAAQQGAAA